MSDNTRIPLLNRLYLAAALFSGPETWFNCRLAAGLEACGYRTVLPQRDGFEFANLGRLLEGKLASEDIPQVVQSIIYLLDAGFFLPRSDAVIANLDEPLDPGMIVEVCHARQMGIPVIGFRTDVRTPYGLASDPFGGMHFFPAYQCDAFVRLRMPCAEAEQAEGEWQTLLRLIDQAIKSSLARQTGKAGETVSPLSSLADKLFGGLEPLHSPESLHTLVERCVAQQEQLRALRPRLF